MTRSSYSLTRDDVVAVCGKPGLERDVAATMTTQPIGHRHTRDPLCSDISGSTNHRGVAAPSHISALGDGRNTRRDSRAAQSFSGPVVRHCKQNSNALEADSGDESQSVWVHVSPTAQLTTDASLETSELHRQAYMLISGLYTDACVYEAECDSEEDDCGAYSQGIGSVASPCVTSMAVKPLLMALLQLTSGDAQEEDDVWHICWDMVPHELLHSLNTSEIVRNALRTMLEEKKEKEHSEAKKEGICGFEDDPSSLSAGAAALCGEHVVHALVEHHEAAVYTPDDGELSSPRAGAAARRGGVQLDQSTLNVHEHISEDIPRERQPLLGCRLETSDSSPFCASVAAHGAEAGLERALEEKNPAFHCLEADGQSPSCAGAAARRGEVKLGLAQSAACGYDTCGEHSPFRWCDADVEEVPAPVEERPNTQQKERKANRRSKRGGRAVARPAG